MIHLDSFCICRKPKTSTLSPFVTQCRNFAGQNFDGFRQNLPWSCSIVEFIACADTSCECQCVAMFFLVLIFDGSLTIVRLRNRTKPVPERPVEHPASHRSILPHRKGAQPRVTVGVGDGSERGKYLWTEGYRTHRTPAVANWRVYTNDGTQHELTWEIIPGTSMYSFGGLSL